MRTEASGRRACGQKGEGTHLASSSSSEPILFLPLFLGLAAVAVAVAVVVVDDPSKVSTLRLAILGSRGKLSLRRRQWTAVNEGKEGRKEKHEGPTRTKLTQRLDASS